MRHMELDMSVRHASPKNLAKLTPAQRNTVRRRAEAGATREEMATDFGVSISVVQRALTGRYSDEEIVAGPMFAGHFTRVLRRSLVRHGELEDTPLGEWQ